MSGVFSVNTIVTAFGVKLKTIPKTVVVFLQAFLSASARSWRRNCPRLEADVAYFNSLQREAGDMYSDRQARKYIIDFNPLQREAGDAAQGAHKAPRGDFNPLQREAGDSNYYQFLSISHTFPYTNQPIFYILHPIPPPIPLSQCAFSSANPLRN